MQNTPIPNTFTSAPLRHRYRVELNATVSEVWALLGDLTRFPEYSLGLEKVDAKVDSSGKCTEYTCHFKLREEGGGKITVREIMRLYEPNRAWVSVSEEPNAFGLINSVTIYSLEPSNEGTIVTLDQYYDAEDLEAMKAEFDNALADICKNLINRFGGKNLEPFVEK